MIEKFLKETVILDTETTGYDPKSVDIVEFATCRMVDGNWTVRDELFGTREPIPFAATAVNNITRHMIQTHDTFAEQASKVVEWIDPDNTKYFVAHNTQYDYGVMKYNFERGGYAHPVFGDDYKKRWICTFRLAKRLLADVKSSEDFQYNQQFLRYYFDLDSQMDPEMDVLPHRASADSYICSFLLLSLIELAIEQGVLDPTADIGEQLISLTWDPMPITKWPYGKKWKGHLLTEIPDSFYLWALENMNELKEDHQYFNQDLATAVEIELSGRLEAEN